MPRTVFVFLLMMIFAGAVQANEIAPLRNANAWATFPTGAWKQMRTTTEVLSADGNVQSRSVTETRSSLDAVEEDGVILRISTICDVGGRKLPSQPQIVKFTFTGSSAGQTVQVKALDDATVSLGGKQIPCQVRRIEYRDAKRTRICVLHLAQEVTPFIVQSQTKTLGETNSANAESTETKIVTLEKPVLLLGQVKNAVHIRSKQSTQAGVTETDSYNMAEVPGGEILAWSKKYDAAGKESRRTTVELIGYGVEASTLSKDTTPPPTSPAPLTYIPTMSQDSAQFVVPSNPSPTMMPSQMSDDWTNHPRRRERRINRY